MPYKDEVSKEAVIKVLNDWIGFVEDFDGILLAEDVTETKVYGIASTRGSKPMGIEFHLSLELIRSGMGYSERDHEIRRNG